MRHGVSCSVTGERKARAVMDALTNPPMPDWNSLSNEDRDTIMRDGEVFLCSCSCDNDAQFYLYEVIRRVLKERECRVFRATMEA